MDDPADPDCETSSGMGGTPPLTLVDGEVPSDAGPDGSAVICTSGTCSDAGDAASDASSTSPCSGEGGQPGCPLARPICNASTAECVQCLANADCFDPAPKCDPATHDCVECLFHSHCGAGKCSPDHECVDCLGDADCLDAAAARCNTVTNTCEPCESNVDCAHFEGYDICDDGECVACTGTEYATCGEMDGTPLVCDSLARSCSDKKERSVGLCQTCVSDAQCNLGQLCVLETFDGTETGYYCVWRKNGGGGAPTACSLARPFVDTRAGATSIDGTTADVCGLALTTCAGYNDFRDPDVNCEPTPDAANDTLCGYPALDDAHCRYFDDDGAGDNFYRCTTPCGSDDDCKAGFACNTGVTPNVCTL